MKNSELEYRSTLAEILRNEPNKAKRREFLRAEKNTGDYIISREAKSLERKKIVSAVTEGQLPLERDSYQALAEASDQLTFTLPGEERNLTKSEQIMLWAHEVLDEYSKFPRQNHAQRKRATSFVLDITRQLLKEPEQLDTVASIWQAKGSSSQGLSTHGESLYQEVKAQCFNEARKSWRDINSQQLAQLVTAYAHSHLAADMAGNVIRGYFSGPKGSIEVIDAMYGFVIGAVDLVNDPKALEEAVKIGTFQTDILPLGSNAYLDFYIARFLSFDNDKLLRKAGNVDIIIFDLHTLTSLDGEQISKRNYDHSHNDLRLELRMEKEMSHLEKRMDPYELRDKVYAMNAMAKMSYLVLPDNAMRQLRGLWPHSVIDDPHDPLRKKYFDYIAPKVHAEYLRRRLMARSREESGDENLNFLNLTLPDGYTLGISVPASSTIEKNQLLRYILGKYPLSDTQRQEITSLPNGVGIFQQKVTYQHTPLMYWYRKLSEFEKLQHPLMALGEIGFPTPEVKITPIRLTEQIQRNQARFLNKRGVRIPLLQEEFTALGYSSVDFHQDENPKNILARFNVGKLSYGVKLDKYLNLDFEGKSFNIPALQDSIHYILLSYLQSILCKERIGSGGEQGLETEQEIISRMGHLRFLPDGYTYTPQAIQNCLQYAGKDLVVLDAVRKAEKHTSRNTTYVKPVIEKEEDLPPIVISIPNAFNLRRV